MFSIQRIEKQYIYVENMKRTGQADSATENDKLKSIKNKKMIKATRKKVKKVLPLPSLKSLVYKSMFNFSKLVGLYARPCVMHPQFVLPY